MSEKNIKIDDSVSVGEESLQNPQAETNQQSWENKYENKKEVEGILEISENGFGFLRFASPEKMIFTLQTARSGDLI